MQKALVGRDANVYSIAYGGLDQSNTGVSLGQSASLLGIWKDISVDLSSDWSDVTPSSANFKVKRRTVSDWKASLENFVLSSVTGLGGAGFFGYFLTNDYAKVIFTEEVGGYTTILLGGIMSASKSSSKEAMMQKLGIENVGLTLNTAGDGGISYG